MMMFMPMTTQSGHLSTYIIDADGVWFALAVGVIEPVLDKEGILWKCQQFSNKIYYAKDATNNNNVMLIMQIINWNDSML